MPVYTYRCSNCGFQFEKTQKFSDPALKKCPECGKMCLMKVYTPVGIVFKGSGFYATDHRSPSGGSSHLTSKHDETKSTEKSEPDSEPVKSTEPIPPAKTGEEK